MFGLAVLSIVNLVLIGVFAWGSQPWWLVVYVDVILTAFFLGDFAFRLVTAPSKKHYLGRVTATTVGYGDQFPVTTGGRLVGWLMLTVGVALFATFSGFLANTFLSAKREQPEPEDETDIGEALREVERLLAEQQRATQALRARIADLG